MYQKCTTKTLTFIVLVGYISPLAVGWMFPFHFYAIISRPCTISFYLNTIIYPIQCTHFLWNSSFKCLIFIYLLTYLLPLFFFAIQSGEEIFQSHILPFPICRDSVLLYGWTYTVYIKPNPVRLTPCVLRSVGIQILQVFSYLFPNTLLSMWKWQYQHFYFGQT